MDYKNGFGDLDFPGEFWLGNQILHEITNRNDVNYKVNIWVLRFDGSSGTSWYHNFRIDNEANGYELHCSSTRSSGTANALFTGTKFSTYDREHDTAISENCASEEDNRSGGGWWYTDCGGFFPNGRYQSQENAGYKKGIFWYQLTGSHSISLKKVSMKIKRM